MKIETYKLNKPYPIFKFCKDNQDIVISIFSFYVRIKR
jgi:hypothetical protein